MVYYQNNILISVFSLPYGCDATSGFFEAGWPHALFKKRLVAAATLISGDRAIARSKAVLIRFQNMIPIQK